MLDDSTNPKFLDTAKHAQRYVGMQIGDAESQAQDEGYQIRVMRLDSEDLIGTMDLRSNRINVATEDDAIVEILGAG